MARIRKKRNYKRNEDGSISIGGVIYGSGNPSETATPTKLYAYVCNGDYYKSVLYLSKIWAGGPVTGLYSYKEYNDECVEHSETLSSYTPEISDGELYPKNRAGYSNLKLERNPSYDIDLSSVFNN